MNIIMNDMIELMDPRYIGANSRQEAEFPLTRTQTMENLARNMRKWPNTE